MPAVLLPWMLTLKEEGPIGLFGLRWLESVDNRQLKHPKRLKEATSSPTMSPTALPTALHRQRLLPANIHRPKQLFIDSSRTFHRHHHRHKSARSPILHRPTLPQHTFLSRLCLRRRVVTSALSAHVSHSLTVFCFATRLRLRGGLLCVGEFSRFFTDLQFHKRKSLLKVDATFNENRKAERVVIVHGVSKECICNLELRSFSTTAFVCEDVSFSFGVFVEE